MTRNDVRTMVFPPLLDGATALREQAAAPSTAAAKKNVVRAIEAVAGVLGNTPAVCRKSYIHPAVLDCYMDGTMEARLAGSVAPAVRRLASKLRADEVAALRILHCTRPATQRTKAA